MSELQSIRVDSLTGGLNTLASKNSMPPNQAIVCSNFIPMSNGAIGPRLGSRSFFNGATSGTNGQTLGFFQGTISNGGRKILMWTHNCNTGDGHGTCSHVFMREWLGTTWTTNHWSVFDYSASTITGGVSGQYQSYAQMQDRVYRADAANGVRRVEFTHQGSNSAAASAVSVTDASLGSTNAVWSNFAFVNDAPANYGIRRYLHNVANQTAPDFTAITAYNATTSTLTCAALGGTVLTNGAFDVISDMPAGLKVPKSTDTDISIVPNFATGGGSGRMDTEVGAAQILNYLYILVPSDPELGDHPPIRPENGFAGPGGNTLGIWSSVAAPATTTTGQVTFTANDLERLARLAWLSPRSVNAGSIKIYRSLFKPNNGVAPVDNDAYAAIPYYFVGTYTVGSGAAFVDLKNDNELVDLYTDTVIFSEVDDFAKHKFQFVCAHRNRMFYANETYAVSSSLNYQRGSRLYWSDLYHPDRVTGFVDVSPNDGGDITAIYSFNGALFVAKTDRVYLLTGSSPSSFDLRLVIPHLGVMSPRSLAAMGNELVWLSQNGFVAFDGSTLRELSPDIKPDVDTLLRTLSQGYQNRPSAMAEIDRYWFFFPSFGGVGGYGFLYDTRHTQGTWWKFTLTTGAEGHTCIALNRATHGGQMLFGSFSGGTLYEWQNTAEKLDGGATNFALDWTSPNMDAGAPELVKQFRHIAVDMEKVYSGGTLTLSWYVDSDYPDVTSGYTASGSFEVDKSTLPQALKFSLPQSAFGRRLMIRFSSPDHDLSLPKINGFTVHYRLKRGARNREETR